MESFPGEQYLFLGAIVQPGITPPVVLDCYERSFFLRSYINRLRSPSKRDPTSSLGSAKAAIVLRQNILRWLLVVLSFLLLPHRDRKNR